MYYVLRFDDAFPKPAMSMATDTPNHPTLVFDRGVRVQEKVSRITHHIDQKGQGTLTDLLWTNHRGLTISSRFKEVLDRAGVDNIDYYPARVINDVTGAVNDDYQVANIIGVVDCLDRGSTKIRTSPVNASMVRGLSEMKLDESRIEDALLFRLKDVKVIIIAHERVKKAVEAAKLTGVVFPEANGFSWP